MNINRKPPTEGEAEGFQVKTHSYNTKNLPIVQSGTDPIDMKSAALEYAQKGFRVFPCKINKSPLTKSGFKDATTDLKVINRWWTKSPNALIGFPTGGGLVVIDVDMPAGPASLEALEKENASLPPTLEQKTGSGGKHLFYLTEAKISNSAGRLGNGLDIRADGGYIILPPSMHQTGNRYEWVNQNSIAPLPEWVHHLLTMPRKKDKALLQPFLSTPYGRKALIEESEKLATTAEGSRNDQLNRSAYSLGQLVAGGELDREHVESALRSAAINAGLSPEEIEGTLQSGLMSGMQEPRTAPGKKSSNSRSSSHHWEEPLLFDEIQTPDIPASLLPGWLGEYVEAVAKMTQTPEGMAVMLGLSTVATCLQKKFIVSPTNDGGYYEPVNIWTVTAMPPASRKTAVISAMTDPLKLWEREQTEKIAEEIIETKRKREINEQRIQKLTRDAAKEEDDKEKRLFLTRKSIDIEKDTPEEIIPPLLWTSDATPERLQGLLVEHGEKMSLLSDEAGIFEVMAGLYNDGRVNIDVFLQAHAGQSVRVDRASRKAHLDAPALTFGLAVQPAIIADLSKGSKKKFRGNGSLARFLYCIPKNNIGQRDVRQNNPIPESVKNKYHSKIIDLLNIEPVVDRDNRDLPRRLVLDADAHECWLQFSEFIEKRQGPNGEYEPIQDWTGKLHGAALRIAGIIHVVEHGLTTITINQSTMDRAINLANLLIKHAQAAFDLMGVDQVTDDARAIFNWITVNHLKQFTRNEVRKAFKGRWTKAERLKNALIDLQNRDIICGSFKAETEGRYAETYPVNPSLWDEITN